MLDRELLEAQLSELPLYIYGIIDPKQLEFSDRVRWICEHECSMYGKSWACPPGVGSVESCKAKCLSYNCCLVVSTITEVADISDLQATLATRTDHETLTDHVGQLMRQQGVEPYILSTEACAICEKCAIMEGKPCRFPEKMHPCVESQGINVIPVLENMGMPFLYGENVVTWVSLLLFRE